MELNYTNQLIPAIVQHARSGEVLMLGYMNEDALQLTRSTGHVTFWSRSRQQLWTKGETSGHYLRLVDLRVDCDRDTLLILAEPIGPTCHTGDRSCFSTHLDGEHMPTAPVATSFSVQLHELIVERQLARPPGSYTTYLFEQGIDKICKKIGEEAAEVIIAAKNDSSAELRYEASDLIYHVYVLLVAQGLAPDAIWQELAQRHGGKPAQEDVESHGE